MMRHSSVLLAPSANSPCFDIDVKNRSYKHQYSNIYFTRLATLKKPVLERANARWKDLDGRCLPVAEHDIRSQNYPRKPGLCPKGTRRRQVSALLDIGHGVYGHATQAKCPRGSWSRRECPIQSRSSIHSPHPSIPYLHRSPEKSFIQIKIASCSRTSPGVSNS